MPNRRRGRDRDAAHSRHVVLPEVETPITLKTLPRAVCFLSHDQVKGQRLQLDSDDRGIVRFHARGAKGAEPIKLRLQSKSDDGKRARHTIELRPDSSGVPTRTTDGATAAKGRLRSPLGDPAALSNRVLLRRGYPPRPDPAESPVRYARWLRIVSRPFTAVSPRLVAHPGVSFARRQLPPQIFSPTLPLPPPIGRTMFNSSNSIWSGAYLTNPTLQFCRIQADWSVPGVVSLPGGPIYSAAAEWIGLDNSGSDLYQAGTDSEIWSIPFFGDWIITNYWMWIESLPFAPWAVPNFPISPYDWVSVDIFVADGNGQTWYQNGSWGGLTAADNSVWFMLYNNTQGVSYWGTLPTASQTLNGLSSSGFSGSTAEFIIERPSDNNGNPYPLAAFGLAGMHSCWYGDSQYGDKSFPLGADGSTPFSGNLSYLNMLNPANSDQLDIAASIPDDSSPNGSAIIWFFINSQ